MSIRNELQDQSKSWKPHYEHRGNVKVDIFVKHRARCILQDTAKWIPLINNPKIYFHTFKSIVIKKKKNLKGRIRYGVAMVHHRDVTKSFLKGICSKEILTSAYIK